MPTHTKYTIWVRSPLWGQFTSRAAKLHPANRSNAIDDAAEVALLCFIQLGRDEAIECLKRIESRRAEPENTPVQRDQRMDESNTNHARLSDDVSKALDVQLKGMQPAVSGALLREEAINAAVHHFCLMSWPEALKAMRNAHGRHLDSNWHEVTK